MSNIRLIVSMAQFVLKLWNVILTDWNRWLWRLSSFVSVYSTRFDSCDRLYWTLYSHRTHIFISNKFYVKSRRIVYALIAREYRFLYKNDFYTVCFKKLWTVNMKTKNLQFNISVVIKELVKFTCSKLAIDSFFSRCAESVILVLYLVWSSKSRC